MKDIGSRAEVWHGVALKTTGGLVKKDLKMSPDGRIVSKDKSKGAKTAPHLRLWLNAVTQAKKEIMESGKPKKTAEALKKGEFVPVKGALATKARKIYAEMREKSK